MSAGESTYAGLAGHRAVVTGGASGIGAAIARGFLRHGCRVAVVDVNAPAEGTFAKDAAVEVHLCDLTDLGAVERTAQAILGSGDVPRFLVNNAARDDRHRFGEITPEAFDALIAVNMRHQFFMLQHFAPAMAAAGGGAIVNMGSHAAGIGATMMPVYGMSKAGIHGLTRAAAREYGGGHVRVNMLVPGWVMTERQKELWWSPEADEVRARAQCIPDQILPGDIAEFTLFLCSDSARLVTNQTFLVDGGRN